MSTPRLAAPLSADACLPYVARLESGARACRDICVVVVAHEGEAGLGRCLSSLAAQTLSEFELIVVAGGRSRALPNELSRSPDQWVRLKQNYGPSLARNIGAVLGRAPLVCFLDDDAMADPGFVYGHWSAHQMQNIVAARGRVVPRSRSIYNRLALHYDLGPAAVPCYLDLEGNCSVRRDVFLQVGGFDPGLFGGEGVELSLRLAQACGDRSRLLYTPGAVIHHDYAHSLGGLLSKAIRTGRMTARAQAAHPALAEFVASYQPLPHAAVPRPPILSDRVRLAVARRAERNLKAWAFRWAARKWPPP